MKQIGNIRFSSRDSLDGGRFGSKFSGKFEDTLDVAIECLIKRKYIVEADSLRTSAHDNILRYFFAEESHNRM